MFLTTEFFQFTDKAWEIIANYGTQHIFKRYWTEWRELNKSFTFDEQYLFKLRKASNQSRNFNQVGISSENLILYNKRRAFLAMQILSFLESRRSLANRLIYFINNSVLEDKSVCFAVWSRNSCNFRFSFSK